MTPDQLLPQHLTEGEGAAYWFIGSLSIVKAISQSTGGCYSLTWDKNAPGHETPYHLHRVEDEAFWVIEGEYEFICDGKKILAIPGDYVFLPRGIPHGIRVASATPATKLVMAMPGDGFQNMMIEMADPATTLELPEPKAPDMEKLFRLCEKYQIDILGPLPE
jgi:mannose-6-phosphate isomerase-like protein (cupin superfamily)